MTEEIRMPFGKHKGEKIDGLPTEYLHWIVENIEDKDWLTNEAQNQLDARDGKGIRR